MADYVVTHQWHQLDGTPYLRIVPGSVPHIDIAFYAADLITEATGQPSAVYLLDPATAQMTRQDRPTEPTMPTEDLPRLRVLPGSGEGDPPDLVTAPTSDGGGISSTAPEDQTDTATVPDTGPTS